MDNNRKLWLVFMAGPGSIQDLKELIEPVWKYFDGIVAVYHGKPTDEEAIYLEQWKRDGEIIYTKFVNRHDFSRNHYLYCGPIKNGDVCCQIDCGERFGEKFLKEIRAHVEYFTTNGVNLIFYYNKPFLFEYHESLQYVGNPHEGLRRNDGKGLGIELSQFFPIEEHVRYNVRNKTRDKYHFVNHYVKYYLYPWGSNHCLLGIEKHGDPKELFPPRDARRIAFREILAENNIDNTVDSLLSYIRANPPEKWEPNIRKIFNEEKILNDFYRYHILQDRSFNDDHDWKNIVKI